ncbi:MAG: DUF433 domain-containing protein [Oscillatoria sp. PMC 1051.18]|nr:DUF433 domain-containing protein [Oscillatoria sp. PMC 1050.18]MEC5033006.1 DUF433 domain-containing protein [Oscillatoria sp. PMC 1051.18]
MSANFTPNEAAAFVQLPLKRVYKEIEYQIITSSDNSPRLNFTDLIYLRAIKSVNFEFSVKSRMSLYQRLVKACQSNSPTLEVAKFFFLQIEPISQELSELISNFNKWKQTLVTDPNILGGETVFPNSRLSVRRIGTMLEKGELDSVIREDYPYLSSDDLANARLYVQAYPSMGRPKKE